MKALPQVAWPPEEAQKAAMAWLQSFADAYERGLISPSIDLDPEAQHNVDREVCDFLRRCLPRLHVSLGTDAGRKATYHLSPVEVANG